MAINREIPSDRAERLIAKGKRHQRTGKVDQARKAYRQALKARSNDVPTLERLAKLELDSGNPRSALRVLRKLATLQPSEPAWRLQIAGALEDAGDRDAAEEMLRELISDRPCYAEAHNNLGSLLQVSNAFEEALESYSEALRLSPDIPAMWVNAGNVFDELGKHVDAISHYSTAIDLKPGVSEPYYFRARAWAALGEFKKSITDVEQCLWFDPADQKGLALLGVLYAALGRHEEERALFDYDRFVRPIRAEPPEGYATIEEFNLAAINHIRNRVTLDYNLYGSSTHGGWHSRNLLQDPHKTMVALRSVLQQIFETYVSQLPSDNDHLFLRRRSVNARLVAQAQILESQGYLSSHIHPGGWISSAYYLSVPDVISQTTEKSGWLEFGRPTAEIKTNVELETRTVMPEPGLAVLFPSYFFHGTRPFKSEKLRISLGVDLIPKR